MRSISFRRPPPSLLLVLSQLLRRRVVESQRQPVPSSSSSTTLLLAARLGLRSFSFSELLRLRGGALYGAAAGSTLSCRVSAARCEARSSVPSPPSTSRFARCEPRFPPGADGLSPGGERLPSVGDRAPPLPRDELDSARCSPSRSDCFERVCSANACLRAFAPFSDTDTTQPITALAPRELELNLNLLTTSRRDDSRPCSSSSSTTAAFRVLPLRTSDFRRISAAAAELAAALGLPLAFDSYLSALYGVHAENPRVCCHPSAKKNEFALQPATKGSSSTAPPPRFLVRFVLLSALPRAAAGAAPVAAAATAPVVATAAVAG